MQLIVRHPEQALVSGLELARIMLGNRHCLLLRLRDGWHSTPPYWITSTSSPRRTGAVVVFVVDV